MLRTSCDGQVAHLAGSPADLRQLVADLRAGVVVPGLRVTPVEGALRVTVVDGGLELSGDVGVVLPALLDVAVAAEQIGSGEVCRQQRLESAGLALVVSADWPL